MSLMTKIEFLFTSLIQAWLAVLLNTYLIPCHNNKLLPPEFHVTKGPCSTDKRISVGSSLALLCLYLTRFCHLYQNNYQYWPSDYDYGDHIEDHYQ